MLIERRIRAGIISGEITVLYRRWRRPQVVAGHVYRTSAGRIAVDSIEEVRGPISDADARRAGQPDAAAAMRGDPDATLYRLAIRHLDEPDPRDELAASADLSGADRAEIDRRLARLDQASSFGAWTRPTLQAIADRPGVRAADLAASFGRETAPFKIDVRKLKNLGLTISLEVGYRLSPRGAAYLLGGATEVK